MKMKAFSVFISAVLLISIHSSCGVVKKDSHLRHFQYESFKASAIAVPSAADTTNAFDVIEPASQNDSLSVLFHHIDSLWKIDLNELKKMKREDKSAKMTIKEQISVVDHNIKSLRSFWTIKSDSSKSNCKEKECPLLVEVVKSKQLMYLYIGGALKDSFAVSTGIPGRETPELNLRPSGPVFIRYTSTKYPEGDYKGLGNMPYAVFVKSGYAIHGTTPGNFAKLGEKASHGCIRLHPDNAKLFYELVNLVGLGNTWVMVR